MGGYFVMLIRKQISWIRNLVVLDSFETYTLYPIPYTLS